VGRDGPRDRRRRPSERRGHPYGNHLTLQPGSYEVVAVTDGGPPTSRPVTIDVQPGHPVRVDLTVDTGIR
jgi:hypothetical protein